MRRLFCLTVIAIVSISAASAGAATAAPRQGGLLPRVPSATIAIGSLAQPTPAWFLGPAVGPGLPSPFGWPPIGSENTRATATRATAAGAAGGFIAARGTASLGGSVLGLDGSPVPGASVTWTASVAGTPASGTAITAADGTYAFANVPGSDGSGRLWVLAPDSSWQLGRTSVSWPDPGATTFSFSPLPVRAAVLHGGPWSNVSSGAAAYLYGSDALSSLRGAGAIASGGYELFSGNVPALAGDYDKTAVYFWSNEGMELDTPLRVEKCPYPSVGRIAAMSFVDASTGWVINDADLVYATTNGGATWSSQSLGPGTYLVDVCFIDALHGWVAKSTNSTSFTTDGGTTWTGAPLTWPVLSAPEALDFADTTNGWVVSGSGVINGSTDGGQTWVRQESTTSEYLQDVAAIDASHAVAVGYSGTIVRTTNGGATWATQPSGTTDHLWAVDFADASHGIAAGAAGTIVATTDGGATWTKHESGIGADLYAVTFPDATCAWIGGEAVLLRSTDHGSSWESRDPGTFSNLVVADALDSAKLWIADSGETIAHTSDGGQTWNPPRFRADEADAQRFSVLSGFGASGNPGSRIWRHFDQFPAGYVAQLTGYSAYPATAPITSFGTWTSSGTEAAVKAGTVPKSARPGYLYIFGLENQNGVLYLETAFQVSLLKASRASIARGGSVSLNGIVPTVGHVGSTPGKSKRVWLFKSTRSASKGYTYVGRFQTDRFGKFKTSPQRPTKTTWYAVRYPGDSYYWADITSPVKVTVR